MLPPVAFIGAVALNQGVRDALRQVFKLDESDFLVPELHAWIGAVGAAILEAEELRKRSFKTHSPVAADTGRQEELRVQRSAFHGERGVAPRPGKPPELPSLARASKIEAYLGIDIGSVSTNLVVIDAEGNVIKDIYLRTEGRPIEVVDQGLRRKSRSSWATCSTSAASAPPVRGAS